jgi:hypothetical protein
VSFRVEPNIVPTAVLGPLQQVLRLGGWGAAMATTHPIAIRRLTISSTSVDLVPSPACRAVGRMMSWRRLAAGKPFDGLVLIMIIEMFDLRFHEMTCNARYYPKKSAI